MEIQFIRQKDFTVYGYAVETELSSCEKDVGQLWEKHKDDLLALPVSKSCLYGVMWYTENHKYSYLLGIKCETTPKSDMLAVMIPAAEFAVASIPGNTNTVEAWTQYFEIELPALNYEPDAVHGKYYELFDAEGTCELWTPILVPE